MEQFPDRTAPDDESVADREAVGVAVFPRSTADLRSTTQCPACFTPLRSLKCSRCALDLSQPAAIDLAAQSTLIADQLDARLALIGRVRRQAAAARPAPDARPVAAPDPAPPSASARVPAQPQAGPGAIPVTAPAAREGWTVPTPSTTDQRPRRSGIQIALIIVGISLLAVFAVFGIVYAFVAYGTGVRTLIVAAGTLATLATATLLARRGLGSTAEGVAALGTVILVLDAWALREQNLAGLGEVASLQYWGVALIAVAAINVLWSRLGRHTTPLLAASALLPLGAGLLAAELAADLPDGGPSAVAGVSAAAIALAHPLLGAGRNAVVRQALIVLAIVAATVGVLVTLLSVLVLSDAGSVVPGIVVGIAVGATAIMHVALLGGSDNPLSGPARLVLSCTIVAVGTVTMIVALTSAASTVGQYALTVGVTVLAGAAAALTAEFALRRWPSPPRRAPLITAVFASGGISMLGAIVALASAAGPLIDLMVDSLFVLPGAVQFDSVVSGPDSTARALLATLMLALGMAAATWALLGTLTQRLVVLTPAIAVLAVVGTPMLGLWWLIMLGLAIAAIAGPIAIGALHAGGPATHHRRRGVLVGLATLTPLSAVVIATVGWAVDGAGILGVVVAILSIGLGRAATTSVAASAVGIGIGTLLVLSLSPALADDLHSLGLDISSSTLLVALSALLVALSAVGRLTRLDAGIASAVAVVGGTVGVLVSQVDGPTWGSTIALAGLLAAVVLLAIRRSGAERFVAAAVAPWAAALLVESALSSVRADALSISAADRALAALGALIVVTVIAFASDRRGTAETPGAAVALRPRTIADVSTVLAVVAVLGATLNTDRAALSLLFAGVAVLVIAVSRDGLLRSTSPRRFVGWLALALAVAALWTWLLDQSVADPEPYALPLAGALALIGFLLARVTPRETAARLSGATVSLVAGLAIALLPLAATAGEGPALRGASVGVVAVLGVLACLLSSRPDATPTARAPGLPGASVGTAAVSLAAQVVLTGSVVIALTDAAGPAPLAPLSQLSGVLIVMMLVGTSLAVWSLSQEPRQNQPAAATAITVGIAALAAGALAASGAVEFVEFVSLPLALGLLTIGTLELERRPTAGSTVWLGPGFLALLIPSLVAIESDDALWRVVAVGMAAAAVFLGGLWRRLRAPFLIGGIVLLTHLLIQSWPLLEDVGNAIEWWLWLGIAGVLVVAVAARYERRVQNLRTALRRIRDLR